MFRLPLHVSFTARLLQSLLLATLLGSALSAAALDGMVAVDGGLISGESHADGVTVFKGIPYAAPPVGALRWKAPQPVVPWRGVRRADQYGAACMQNAQKPGTFYQVEFYKHPEPFSEDCLFLNLWTTAKSAQTALPVMVWIHGGGFVEGSGSLPSFDGENLAKKGVVLVTINYRMGVFGFLAHPELTQESSDQASGNYGLLDQRAALLWIRKNIRQFGGDPDRVTIFGQSAGAMSVLAHTASPLDQRLFVRAIMQSGGFIPMPPLKVAEQAGVNFMKAASASSIADLRAKPATELLEAATAASKLTTNVSRFFPVVDGYFLRNDILTTFEQGTENPVSFMTGSTSDEGTTLIPTSITLDDYKKMVETKFGEKASEFLKLYPAENDAQAWRSQVDNLRDTMAASSLKLAKFRAKAGDKSYIYYFDRDVPGRDSQHYKAFHSSELVYVFDDLDAVDRPWTPLDKNLAQQMSSYWVNFAATGNPNGHGLTDWPAFGRTSTRGLELGNTVQPNLIPDRTRLEELNDHHFSLMF